MNLLAPLALIGGLLAIPIVLLYMLRLRRREVVISSNFLWAQVIRDTEANAPWQRLRRNLLLILQLILLALLVLALARPFQVVPAFGAGRIAVLIDASASMSATDGPGGLTRFDQARDQARALIDSRAPDDVITLIRVGDAPDVIAPYTSDGDRLSAALDAMEPGGGGADWDAALTLAAAGGRGADDFDVLILSDGGGMLRGANDGGQGGRTLPPIPGDLRYLPVGSSAENVGITALAIDALTGGSPQLFAQIVNTGTQAADVVVDLRIDDQLVQASRVTIPPGAAQPFILQDGLPVGFAVARLGIAPASDSAVPDHLALDNAAWTTFDESQRRVLLVSAGNVFLEEGLESLPRVELTRIDAGAPLPATAYDLIVFDGAPAPRLPDSGALLFVNPPGSVPSLFTVGISSEATAGISVQRDDPRMTYVDFSAISLLRFRQVTADWADALITAEGGPLLLAGETDGRRIAILPFDVRESDLPLTIQFPILLASLTDWFIPPRTVTLPDDARNLFDPAESVIAPAESIRIGGAPLAPADDAETGQREYWDVLALAALAIALIEWFVYHRRTRYSGGRAPRSLLTLIRARGQ